MKTLKVALSRPPDPYTDRGCFDDLPVAEPGPATQVALQRDDYVCQFCGFQSAAFQTCQGSEAEGADCLATACLFCHQVMNLDKVPSMRSGVLIWLPELSQSKLNAEMPEIYVLRNSSDDATRSRARDLLDRFMERRSLAKSRFGTDDPSELVRRLSHLGEDGSEIDDILEAGLRILPLDRRIIRVGRLEFNQFPQILAFWRSREGPFASGRSRSFDQLELELVKL